MRTLDLFCGAAGGWSLGLHRAGFTTVAACEIDDWRRACFSSNNPGVTMYADIRDLTGAQLEHDVGRIECIVGSPPCQDASSANAKGKGVDGARTGLFFEALRLVREVRPDWVCLENVPGLKSRGYDRIHDELEAAGYQCRPLVVGAWHAGADHRRNRVWICANAKSVGRSERRSRGSAASTTRQHEQAFRPNTAEVLRPSVSGNKSNRIAARLWASLWNGGVAARCGMVDGVPKGLAEKLLSAYGDAVVPVLPELIGRAILQINAAARA